MTRWQGGGAVGRCSKVEAKATKMREVAVKVSMA
jgi:hypothetical protein